MDVRGGIKLVVILSYDRTSKNDQHKVSNSAQFNHCRENSISRHGIEPLRFSDKGISGGTDQRPGFQSLQRAISELKEPAFLYVWRYDRIARNVNVALKFLDLCKAHQVEVVSLSEPLPSSTASHALKKMAVQLLFINADMQRSIISENVTSGMAYRRSKGMYIGSQVAYGYQLKKGKVLLDSVACENVRLIYSLYLSGEYGYKRIVQSLNEQGKTYRNRPFKLHNVTSVLSNEIYTGIIPGGQFGQYEGTFQAIVTNEEFQTVQRIKQSRSSNKKDSEAYPLRKCIECPYCHRKLTPKMQKTERAVHRYYYCANVECQGIFINKEQIEQKVYTNVMNFFSSEDSLDQLYQELDRQLTNKKNLQRKTQQQHKRSKKSLVDQLESGEITSAAFKQALSATSTEVQPTLTITREELRQAILANNGIVLTIIMAQLEKVMITTSKTIKGIYVRGLLTNLLEGKTDDRK